jgi:cytochrome d ubiquinol oxidase subunit II
VLGWIVWSHIGLHEGFVPQPIDVIALLAIAGGGWLAESRSEGPAFAAGAVALGGSVGSIFFKLYPHVMVSSTNPQFSLTVSGSASPDYTLKVMTVVAVVFTPIVIGYQAWSLWTFRKRLGTPPEPATPPEGPMPTDSTSQGATAQMPGLGPIPVPPPGG